jgi:hypothetical protein
MPVSLCIAPRARYHWELNASRLETGILIPSDFVNWASAGLLFGPTSCAFWHEEYFKP